MLNRIRDVFNLSTLTCGLLPRKQAVSPGEKPGGAADWRSYDDGDFRRLEKYFPLQEELQIRIIKFKYKLEQPENAASLNEYTGKLSEDILDSALKATVPVNALKAKSPVNGVKLNGANGHVNLGFEEDLNAVFKRSESEETVGSLYSNEQSISNKHHFFRGFIENLSASRRVNKPVLFFIHGLGQSADVWVEQLKFFAKKRFGNVALDLIGHGFSTGPDVIKLYQFNTVLQMILAVFDSACRGTRSAVLVGHAYGCLFAAAVAKLRPGSVCQLVMLSSGGPVPLCPSNQASILLKMPTCLWKIIKCLVASKYYHRGTYYTLSGRQMPIDASIAIPPYVLHHFLIGQCWDYGADQSFFKQIRVPTLLIGGLKDTAVTLIEMSDMEKCIPRSFLQIIPNAGHFPMLDSPAELNELMFNFVAQLTTS